MKAILVDDEERSRRILKNFIKSYCPTVSVIGEADNIDTAYNAIIEHQPNLVFLDIDMPPFTGFDLLKKFDRIPFEIIFVTAYDYYAIDAIKFSALYYILKPIKVEELKAAIEKATNKLQNHSEITTKYIQQLNPVSLDRIVINTAKDSKLLSLEDILYIESDSVYSTFHLQNDQKVTCSQKNLSEYEELLGDKGFFRSHRSFLVNLKHILSVQKQDGGELVLKNKMTIPLARRRKEDFLKVF
jgi:two-component system LytT family response regulator